MERSWLHYEKGMDDKYKTMRWFFIDAFEKNSDNFGKGEYNGEVVKSLSC